MAKHKPTPRTYPKEVREQAIHYWTTLGPSEAAKKTGIARSTINRWAKQAGAQKTPNTTTRAATKARLEKIRALRTQEALATMETAVRLRQQMDTSDWDSRQKRDQMTAYGIAIDKSQQLERFDDDGGISDTISLIEMIADKLGIPNDTK
ncbi:hypothetical protein QDX21_03445 [Auritidibacter ignavus]|uniref:Uncharacterized protein n=1 Tax=Auritidibacter ignavus TaxID=678932 RepID=A0AAJ6API6_9MICC|nr:MULTISPECIES: hypothetical protein [Auritidibacter]PXA77925.1 hypothetical protein DCC24_03255 [Auritidibacter sp. NML100628]WGH93866.1 hypothetical protein QDX21_03445 [Auritidibacter ignavus]